MCVQRCLLIQQEHRFPRIYTNFTSPSADPEGDPFLYLTLSFPGRVDLKFPGSVKFPSLFWEQCRCPWVARFRELASCRAFFFFFLPLLCPAVAAQVLEPHAPSRILWLIPLSFLAVCSFVNLRLIFMFDKIAVCYLKQQIYGKLKMNINKNPINFFAVFTFSKWML